MKAQALGDWSDGRPQAARIALIGPTLNQARAVMIEGKSGLLAIHMDDERPRYEPSKRLLTWPNGAIAQVFSADEPDSLRGPQFDAAWCDELAKWRLAQEVWDMLAFALRLGERPRAVITTTPRPVPLLKTLMADPATALTREISQPQFSALVSFAFNVGASAFLRSSVLKAVNAGRFDEVPALLGRWVRADGRVLDGLVRRRAAEGELFARGSAETTPQAGRGLVDLILALWRFLRMGTGRPA